jgi:hypothetical protein
MYHGSLHTHRHLIRGGSFKMPGAYVVRDANARGQSCVPRFQGPVHLSRFLIGQPAIFSKNDQKNKLGRSDDDLDEKGHGGRRKD